jgi:hypothetical protein
LATLGVFQYLSKPDLFGLATLVALKYLCGSVYLGKPNGQGILSHLDSSYQGLSIYIGNLVDPKLPYQGRIICLAKVDCSAMPYHTCRGNLDGLGKP